MSSNPTSIGNPFQPVITDREMRMIILHQGQQVIHRRKDTKCATGWKNNIHDPACGTCSSRAGYIYIDNLIKGLFTQRNAHAMYQVDNLSTIIGKNERIDAELYTEFHRGRVVRRDDIMIRKQKFLDDIEFTVVGKKLMYGTFGHYIGWQFFLFKSPKADSIAPSETENL